MKHGKKYFGRLAKHCSHNKHGKFQRCRDYEKFC